MEAVGRGEGIAFKYGGKTGNTRDSHRLIAEAGARGGDMQDRLVNVLFHEYFEVNDDISDKATLARIATGVGLFGSEEEGIEFLKSEKRGAEVDKEVDFNQYRRGISGVPHFTIEGTDFLAFGGLTGQVRLKSAAPKSRDSLNASSNKSKSSRKRRLLSRAKRAFLMDQTVKIWSRRDLSVSFINSLINMI